MALMKMERTSAPIASVTFSRNPSPGEIRRKLDFMQPSDFSDTGDPYCYNKSIAAKMFKSVTWRNIARSDYDNFMNFLTTINGAANSFILTDVNGLQYTAYVTNANELASQPLMTDRESLDVELLITGPIMPGAPAFSRASVAYDPDNLAQVTSGNPRYVTGNGGSANGAVLIEPGTTNLVLYSQDIYDQAWWTKTNITGTANSGTAPDGTTTADQLSDGSASGNHLVSVSGITITAGGLYSWSGYLKAGSMQYVRLLFDANGQSNYGVYATFDLVNGTVMNSGASGSGGTVLAAAIDAIGSGWYRCSITGYVQASDTACRLAIVGLNSAGAAWIPTYIGTSATFYAWGMQFEIAQLSSYMPTSGSTAARAGEALTIPAVLLKGSWSVKMDYKPFTVPANNVKKYLFEAYIDASNYYRAYVDESGRVVSELKSGGTLYQNAVSAALVHGTWYQIVVAGNGSIIKTYVNGAATDAGVAYVEPAGSLPATMNIGGLSGGNQAGGAIDNFRILSRALSPSEVLSWYQNSSSVIANLQQYTAYQLDFSGNLNYSRYMLAA